MLSKNLFIILILLITVPGIYAQGVKPSTVAKADTTETPKKGPIFRPTKDQIDQVQTILNEKKLYNGEANGKYNVETRAGIKAFQKDNGLKETGTLNRATLEKFGVELTDSQKLIPVSPGSFASASDEKKATKSSSSKSSSMASSDEKPKKAAPFRATPDQIKAAQKLLRDEKMYDGEETGKLNDPTRDGLKKFQEAKGIKVTGTLNALTLEKMGIELTDKQKETAMAAPKN